MIAESYGPRTLVLTSGSQERTCLNYYFKRRTDPVPPFPAKTVARPHRLGKQVRRAHTVWLLDYKKGLRYSTKKATPELAARGTLVMRKRFNQLMVFQYDMKTKPKANP
jgi:hypothetical protein